VKILKAEFIRSCVRAEQFPTDDVPEIAFAGRSNVGKSSLINSLLNRRGLAKVSRTPGKTRAVNLFSVATDDPALPRFLLVDLPGYGYAKVSKDIRAQWAPLIEQYLRRRTPRLTVVLLVESRAAGALDRQTVAWLTSIGRPPLVVATKADKLKPGERVKALRLLRETLDLPDGAPFTAYSSATGEGRDHLWAMLKERSRT
jgi:GTP-binding protein